MVRGQHETRVPPHRWVPDPDVAPDHRGRRYCRACGCPGTPGDARHPDQVLTDLDPEVQQIGQRIIGESTPPTTEDRP